jgi:hypothetical protein
MGTESVVLGQQHSPAILALLLDLVGAVEFLLQHSSDLKYKIIKITLSIYTKYKHSVGALSVRILRNKNIDHRRIKMHVN